MAKSNTLEIIIRAKDAASGAFKKAGSATDLFRKRVKSLSGAVFNLKTGLAGLGLGLLARDLMQSSDVQAKAVLGLETAMRSMGRYTPELSAELQDLASSMQEVTNFGDEATIAGQKFLVTYRGITDDLLPRSSKAMLDLAALMGGDTVQAANMLGKASLGMTGELKRVGIVVSKQTYELEGFAGVLREIETQAKGQARAMREATGSSTALSNSFGDIKEKIGDIIKLGLENTFQKILDKADKINRVFGKLIKEADFKKYIEEVGDELTKQIEAAGKKAWPLIKSLGAGIFALVDELNKHPEIIKYGFLGYFFFGKKGAAIGAIIGANIDKLKAAWEEGGFVLALWELAGVMTEIEKELLGIGEAVDIDPEKQTTEFGEKWLAVIEKIKTAWQEDKPSSAKPEKQGATPAIETIDTVPVPSAIALAKSHLMRLKASTKTALVILENTYKDGEIALEQYFAERLAKIEKQHDAEIAALQKLADAETKDPNKKLAIEDQIFQKKEEHARILLELTRQQTEAEDALAQKKLEVAEMLSDLKHRASEELDAPQAAELAEMDERHREELESFKTLLDDKLAAELGYINEADALKDVSRKQQTEKDKLMAEQQKEIWDKRLDLASSAASSLKGIFEDLYELGGSKSKKMFKLMKKAAIAEAFINTSKAVTGALGTPPYGLGAIATAALIAIKGGLEIAKIKAQEMASGGMVGGYSPHEKADNIHIKGTAGEFMQPVSSVKYYGASIMEGIRQKLIPRELFAGFALPAFARAPVGSGYAEGGPVTARDSSFSVSVPINISGDSRASGIAGMLQNEVEETVIRVMERELR